MNDLISKYKFGKALLSDEKQIIRNLLYALQKENPGISVSGISKVIAKNTGYRVATCFSVIKRT